MSPLLVSVGKQSSQGSRDRSAVHLRLCREQRNVLACRARKEEALPIHKTRLQIASTAFKATLPQTSGMGVVQAVALISKHQNWAH